MTPLDKILAAASRLIGEAERAGSSAQGIRLREIAAAIRGAVATIQRALEAEAPRAGRTARFSTIVGDESVQTTGGGQF